MKDYQYLIEPKCYEVIYSFYHNVALKYRHTYSEELISQDEANIVGGCSEGNAWRDNIEKLEKYEKQ